MKSKRGKFVLVVLLFLLFAAIITIILFFFKTNQATLQPNPGASIIHAGIQTVDNRLSWSSNTHIPLMVSAAAAYPIKTIALYINNAFYKKIEQNAEFASTSYSEIWDWQPGTEGNFILIVYAVDIENNTGISQPLLISVSGSQYSVSPLEVSSETTLASISESREILLEELQKVNPGLDPSTPIGEGESINLPNKPDPITNLNIIPGFSFQEENSPTLPAEPEIPSQDTAGDLQTPLQLVDPGDINFLPSGNDTEKQQPVDFFKNLADWLKETAIPLILKTFQSKDNGTEDSSDLHLPIEPVVFADFKNCDATIRLQNAIVYVDVSDPLAIKNNEEGFYLYRSRDGSTFERIATWPKITELTDAYADLYAYGYKDIQQYGLTTYYISAFNNEGEIPGKPVTIPFSDAGCQNPNPDWMEKTKTRLEDGVLILPFGMDLAYFYIQQDLGNNQFSPGWRVPEGDRTFQPDSGIKLNLYSYLTTQPQLNELADLDLLLQIWGWSGGNLIHAGDFSVSIHRSILLVCSVEGEGGCTGNGGGQWLSEINISTAKPLNEQKYEIRWLASTLSPLRDVCIQLASGPYPNEDFWQVNLPISSYCMDVNKNEGTFLLDFSTSLYAQGPKNAGKWGVGSHLMEFDSNWFQYEYLAGEPFTLYMRAYPRHKTSGFNRYTNIALLHYNTPAQPSEMPPLSSKFSSLYDVEILRDSYVPLTFDTLENWGCVVVEEDPTGQFAVGQIVCPPSTNTKHDDCEGQNELWCLVKGFGSSLGELYDYVLMGWNGMKQFYAEAIAKIIPYCSESEGCVNFLRKAIDYGIQYATGIPANPPNSEDLIADSIASYIVNSAVEGEKYYTDMDTSAIETFCEQVVDCEKEISDRIKSELKKSRSIASQPACIYQYDAYFHGKEGMCLDPAIIVHPAPGSGNFPALITVKITRKTTPESLAAKAEDTGNYRLNLTVKGENSLNGYPLSGNVYEPSLSEIPWINPGESFYVSITLPACKNCNLEALYFGGTAHMEATESCYSPGSSWEWVPCLNGGKDTWDFINPGDKFSDEVGQP